MRQNAMTLSVKMHGALFVASVLSGALVIFLATMYSGTHGVYLFDTGINHHMGWLIHEGWLPYRDFTLPLTPLSGLLTALGYEVFGITFKSAAYVAALLSALAFLYIFNCLRSLCAAWLAVIVALTVVLGTLPIIGTVYYGHLAELLEAMVCARLFQIIFLCIQSSLRTHDRCMTEVFFLCALLVLTKFHVGAVFGLLALAIDCWCLLRIFRVPPWGAVKSIALQWGPSLVIAALFLAWLRFDVAAISHDLLHTATFQFFGLMANRDAWIDASTQSVPDIHAMPQLTPLYFALSVSALGVACWHQRRLKGTVRAAFGFSLVLLIVHAGLAFMSGETSSAGLGVMLLALFGAGVALVREDQGESQRRDLAKALAVAAFLPIVALQLHFEGLSIYLMARKSWNEATGQFPRPAPASALGLRNDVAVPFFRDIWVRPDQKAVFEYCYQLSAENPDKTIIFGPELEMFYAATNRLPPRGWPLWLHPGVSVNAASFPILADRLRETKPAIIIFATARQGFSGIAELQQGVNEGYSQVKAATPSNWVSVFVRKDNTEVKMPPAG